jgi:hypothetical protein
VAGVLRDEHSGFCFAELALALFPPFAAHDGAAMNASDASRPRATIAA